MSDKNFHFIQDGYCTTQASKSHRTCFPASLTQLPVKSVETVLKFNMAGSISTDLPLASFELSWKWSNIDQYEHHMTYLKEKFNNLYLNTFNIS